MVFTTVIRYKNCKGKWRENYLNLWIANATLLTIFRFRTFLELLISSRACSMWDYLCTRWMWTKILSNCEMSCTWIAAHFSCILVCFLCLRKLSGPAFILLTIFFMCINIFLLTCYWRLRKQFDEWLLLAFNVYVKFSVFSIILEETFQINKIVSYPSKAKNCNAHQATSLITMFNVMQILCRKTFFIYD